MLRFGRKLTTARTARRLRFHGYNLMLARDHINHAWGLNQLIKYVFREDKITVRTWPFSIAVLPSAFRVYEIKKAADGYAFPHT
jgi:hypothetical protein